MKRTLVFLMLACFALPALSSTHKYQYTQPCKTLWLAVKDTLRNSGKYGILSISDSEMTASYFIGGNLTGRRSNTAILNSSKDGAGCELQIQTIYSGLFNKDESDFKKRVDDSLDKLKNEPTPAPAEQPSAPATQAEAAVSVNSTPAGADIEIDGSFVGNTPSKVTLTPGTHTVVVKKSGFGDWSKTLTVTSGTITLSAELEQVK